MVEMPLATPEIWACCYINKSTAAIFNF